MITAAVIATVLVALFVLGLPIFIGLLMLFLRRRKAGSAVASLVAPIQANLPAAEPWEHRVAGDLLDELARKKARAELLSKMQEAAANAAS
jgi:hypothetical protein